MRRIVLLLLFFGLSFPLGSGGQEPLGSKDSGRKATSGDVVVYRRLAVVDLTKPVPLSLQSLTGLKLAFQTRGTVDAEFTLHNDLAKPGDWWHTDMRPQRGVYKLTGASPYVKDYRWGGGNCVPCLYRMDLFAQDGIYWRHLGKPVEGKFSRLDFKRPGSAINSAFQVRNLVIYRGEDNVAPEAPTGLTAQADENGIRLSWKPAADNVGVALYVISRAGGSDTTFAKIAQTTEPEYTDAPPAAGNYRYRVLAVDYERNLGPWSQDLSVQAGKAFAPPAMTALVQDSRWYAGHIRATHEAGEGKVRKGTILFYGDALHYLDRTRNFAAAMEGLLTHSCVNENGIRPCRPTARLLAELPAELELRPEFCLISAGIEDIHPTPFSEDAQTSPQVRKKTLENVLAMVRLCEERHAVTMVATLTQFGHTAPKGSPEEKLSDDLARMCEEHKIPVVRVFDIYRQAQEKGEDYKRLMHWMEDPLDKRPKENSMWRRGYEYSSYEPSFEFGITKRFIVVKETLDQVLFTLLDRPDR
jgi:hypothetical protein